MGLIIFSVAAYPFIILLSPIISLIAGLVASVFDGQILFNMIFS